MIIFKKIFKKKRIIAEGSLCYNGWVRVNLVYWSYSCISSSYGKLFVLNYSLMEMSIGFKFKSNVSKIVHSDMNYILKNTVNIG